MGIERKKGQSSKRRQALVGIIFFVVFLALAARAEDRDPFRKVKEAVRKSGKPHYFTEANLDLGTSKQRILIVFIDAVVADWSVSYNAVDGASRVLFIGKPSLSRSIAFERWAKNESK